MKVMQEKQQKLLDCHISPRDGQAGAIVSASLDDGGERGRASNFGVGPALFCCWSLGEEKKSPRANLTVTERH